jgi:ABC-2 type transport system ATP-binding protein
LPGVRSVEINGDSIVLQCHDSDVALRSLLATYPAVRHLEVVGANLTDAFLTLTRGDHQ